MRGQVAVADRGADQQAGRRLLDLVVRTMLTYAPQRHRLPLIRSRISTGVSFGSAVRSSVTALGPTSVSMPAAEQSWPSQGDLDHAVCGHAACSGALIR